VVMSFLALFLRNPELTLSAWFYFPTLVMYCFYGGLPPFFFPWVVGEF